VPLLARHPPTPHPFRIYAHRGACAELPENTLPAFARALDLGCDALETDVHLTRDGHIVVHHDRTGHRTAGIARAIAATPLADIQRWDAGRGITLGGRGFAQQGYSIPTLAELLRSFPAVPINVDIKAHGKVAAAAVVALIDRLGESHRVTLTSVDDATCRALRALRYPGAVGLGKLQGLFAVSAPNFLLRRFRPDHPGGSALQIPWKFRGRRFDRAEVVARARALGVRLDYWTIDDAHIARHIVALGADGIMTNDPAAVVGPVRLARATVRRD